MSFCSPQAQHDHLHRATTPRCDSACYNYLIRFLTLYQAPVTDLSHLRIGLGKGYGSPSPSRLDKDIYRTDTGFTNSSVPILTNGKERFAYVTFLSGTVDQEEDLEEDNYFIATRILVWQLLHKRQTRANGIDVIVMVTPSVSTSRHERLRRDGAIVYPVDFLHVENDSWVHAAQHRWDDVMTKLRAWEMIQYSRILMLDGHHAASSVGWRIRRPGC